LESVVLEFVVGLLPNAFRGARRFVRQRIFRFRDRHPPISPKDAFNAAFSVLAGNIEQAIPFRDIDSDKTFIAVLRSNGPDSHEKEVYLLEQVGSTYRPIWATSWLFGSTRLTVVDPAITTDTALSLAVTTALFPITRTSLALISPST
jgi:hypothetical protein